MKKIYCTKCKKHKELKKLKISYISDKTLLLSSICNKSGSEESIEILKILDSINNM